MDDHMVGIQPPNPESDMEPQLAPEHEQPLAANSGATFRTTKDPHDVVSSIEEEVHIEQREPDQSMEESQDQPVQRVESAGTGESRDHQELEPVSTEPGRICSEREESSSLFIPEQRARSPPPTATPSQFNMPPPPPPAARPPSRFARFRNMQKRHLSAQRVPASKASVLHSYKPASDGEAYLEAVIESNQKEEEEATVNFDYGKADRKAEEEYKKKKQHYNELQQKNGHLSFREDVAWMKIQSAEKARREKRRRDALEAQQEHEAEPDLFPQVHPSNDREDDDLDDGSMQDLDLASSPHKLRRSETPRKQAKHLSIQEAELRAMNVALDANGDLPKKKKKKKKKPKVQLASDGSQSQSVPSSSRSKSSEYRNNSSSRSNATGKTTSKRPRKTVKQKRELAHALKQTTPLFNANVFEQQALEDAPEEPTFRSRNKGDALKELIASVPIENLKQAKTDSAALLAASRDFDGRGAAKPSGNHMWLVKGMKTSLKAYQLMGSAFMRRRENALEEPRGGLMADQMGLGKTLMMLANIVNGHPGKGAKCKTTLLVASPALLTQWAREIDTHTKADLQVMRYSSGTRVDSTMSYKILESHDIILTTYTEVMRSYPKNDPPIECQTAEQKMAWWKKTFEEQRGVLHRMMFYRIVLDEAQAIKNHTSRTSIACRALMARHKWALSGTPILNSLTELYAYFKFLGVSYTGSFKIFKNNYCNAGDSENTERLLVRLSQFMIRRTHADVMFGAPILKLPKADQLTHWCEFNSVERSIYDIVRRRISARINMLARSGDLEKSYSNALVMLLRLRQMTAHVLMLQFVMRDVLERVDIEQIREVVNEQAADSSTDRGRAIIAITKQLEIQASEERKRTAKATKAAAREDDDARVADDNKDNEMDLDEDALGLEDDNEHFGGRSGSGKSFGKAFNFKPFLDSLTTGDHWEKVKQRAQCAYCDGRPARPLLTSCGHIMCEACYDTQCLKTAEEGGEDRTVCGACHRVFTTAHRVNPDDDSCQEYTAPTTRARKKRADKERIAIEQEDIPDDWLSVGGSEVVLPSAKTIAIKAQIMNWVKENKDVKIIIYTQFLAMIRILGRMCQEEKWQTEQYHGKLSFTARDKAICNFAENANVRVLLASLRCGGLGLNLTMASRVIVLDPWWNSSTEQQAFCRVYRFGQKETTFLTRFCVKNTVDHHLIDMQERKQREINEVMEDKNATAKKMSLRDLMRLFGNISEDDSGRPFILVDNADPRGGLQG